MPITQSLILGVSLFLLLSCQNESAQETLAKQTKDIAQMADKQSNDVSVVKQLTLTGHMRYQKMEGGFFGFIDNKGNKYTLIDLPKAHLLDGLALEIKGEIEKDYATTTQFGEVFRVQESAVLGKTPKPSKPTEL